MQRAGKRALLARTSSSRCRRAASRPLAAKCASMRRRVTSAPSAASRLTPEQAGGCEGG